MFFVLAFEILEWTLETRTKAEEKSNDHQVIAEVKLNNVNAVDNILQLGKNSYFLLLFEIETAKFIVVGCLFLFCRLEQMMTLSLQQIQIAEVDKNVMRSILPIFTFKPIYFNDWILILNSIDV